MGQSATSLLQEGIDLADDGEYESAVAVLTRAIAADPANAHPYFERAMALLNLDCDVQALEDFTRALERNPTNAPIRQWRARTFSGLGEHRASAEDWLRSLRDQPEGPHRGSGVCPQNWADCAEEFAKAGDPEQAIALLEEYLDLHASRVTIYAVYATAPLRVLARLLSDKGHVERARELAARACASPHRVPADKWLAERLGIPCT
jgi:tetratricopeptide (TPR) repeat protein